MEILKKLGNFYLKVLNFIILGAKINVAVIVIYVTTGMINGYLDRNAAQDRKNTYIESHEVGNIVKGSVRDRIVSIFSNRGRGTGWILEEGVILTAEHVVAKGNIFTVLNAGGGEKTYYKMFASANRDLAILVDSAKRQVTKKSLETLRVTSQHRTAYAYGYGEFSKLMKTKGKVGPFKNSRFYRSYNSPFISGMSGGPILDRDDKLIGIVSAGYPLYHRYSAEERARLIKVYEDYILYGTEANQSEVFVGRILKYPAIGVSSVAVVEFVNYAIHRGYYRLNEIRAKANP